LCAKLVCLNWQVFVEVVFFFLKAIAGGVICLFIMWTGILLADIWWIKSALAKQGTDHTERDELGPP
jgi:hypothetical protein